MVNAEFEAVRRAFPDFLSALQEIHDERHNHPIFAHTRLAGEWIHVHNSIVPVSEVDTIEEWTW